MQTALFLPKKSWLTGLDFRVKVFFILAVLVVDYVVADSLLTIASLFLLLCVLAVSAGSGRDILLKSARFFVAIVLLAVAIQGVFHGGSGVLLRFPASLPALGGRPLLTTDGILFGLQLGLKLLTVALTSILMVVTTPPTRIVQGLIKFGIPFKYATLATMIFRFYPVMASEFTEIQQAQASRGFEVEKGSVVRRFMNFVPLMIPALLSALRRSTNMAISLDFRGYSLDTKRTFLHDTRFGAADAAFLACTLALIGVFILLR
jgi:energy-coupling factor transport system permease protein